MQHAINDGMPPNGILELMVIALGGMASEVDDKTAPLWQALVEAQYQAALILTERQRTTVH